MALLNATQPCVAGRIFTPHGMAELSMVALDSRGGEVTISKAAVKAARLTTHDIEPRHLWGWGTAPEQIKQCVMFDLTVRAVTKPVTAFITEQDLGIDALLGPNALSDFGIALDCRTSPMGITQIAEDKSIHLAMHSLDRTARPFAGWYVKPSSQYFGSLLRDFHIVSTGLLSTLPSMAFSFDCKEMGDWGLEALSSVMDVTLEDHRRGMRGRPVQLDLVQAAEYIVGVVLEESEARGLEKARKGFNLWGRRSNKSATAARPIVID